MQFEDTGICSKGHGSCQYPTYCLRAGCLQEPKHIAVIAPNIQVGRFFIQERIRRQQPGHWQSMVVFKTDNGLFTYTLITEAKHVKGHIFDNLLVAHGPIPFNAQPLVQVTMTRLRENLSK